jgi:hypothetical protein
MFSQTSTLTPTAAARRHICVVKLATSKLCAGNSDQQRVVSGFAGFAPHKSLLCIK